MNRPPLEVADIDEFAHDPFRIDVPGRMRELLEDCEPAREAAIIANRIPALHNSLSDPSSQVPPFYL